MVSHRENPRPTLEGVYQQYVLTAKVNVLLISVGVGKNVYLKHQKWGGGTEEEKNKGKKTS